MHGSHLTRITRETEEKINDFLRHGDRNLRYGMVLEAVYRADMKMEAMMKELGINRSNRKQFWQFLSTLDLNVNGHPDADDMEKMHIVAGQVRDDLRMAEYEKELGDLLSREGKL